MIPTERYYHALLDNINSTRSTSLEIHPYVKIALVVPIDFWSRRLLGCGDGFGQRGGEVRYGLVVVAQMTAGVYDTQKEVSRGRAVFDAF